MPFAHHDGVRLYWRADGHADRPPLLLLNSLGTDFAMWDGVVPLLTSRFRVLRMDTRGHGASDAPAGDYTIAMLADDALAILDAAGVQTADVCGLSMGGMIALQLAIASPSRVKRVVAANTSAQVPAEPWLQRATLVREKGLGTIVDAIMGRFFSEPCRAANPPALGTARQTFLALQPEGYAACCMAIGRMDIFDSLPTIRAPLLVINGARDEATPPAQHGDRIAVAVTGARTTVLDTGHIAAMERPAEFAAAVLGFLG